LLLACIHVGKHARKLVFSARSDTRTDVSLAFHLPPQEQSNPVPVGRSAKPEEGLNDASACGPQAGMSGPLMAHGNDVSKDWPAQV
jgi:hypothetical protein